MVVLIRLRSAAIMGNGGTGSADLNEYGLAQFDRYSQVSQSDPAGKVAALNFKPDSIFLPMKSLLFSPSPL